MSVVLDAHQRQVVEEDPNRSMLIFGEAGFGKTTAALHRCARLAGRTLVLVPTGALAKKWERELSSLRVAAEVRLLDDWLGREARRVFADIAEHDSEQAGPEVLRFKRHPAVLEVLQELAEMSAEPACRADLFELWGDTRLLDDVVEAADGVLTDADARCVHDHATIQFAEVDRNSDGTLILGMGGVPLHRGTPIHDALTLDVEDYPVLFALERLRGGGRRPRRFGHVVVDEAQEFAPLELALIGRAVARGGAVTVVGDAAQQVDPTAWFDGWEATLRALGKPSAMRLRMEHSHRCPPSVVALARCILEGGPVGTPGDAVRIVRHASARASFDALAAWVASDAAPGQTTALIAPDRQRASELAASLPEGIGARLALRRADRLAGVVVTTVDRVRGLEVDRVAVPELDPEAWPSNRSARNTLYLAVTRATRGVWLGTGTDWSPLIRPRAAR